MELTCEDELISDKAGCPNSVLEGHHPADFSSNLPKHTCLEVFPWLACSGVFNWNWRQTWQDSGPPARSRIGHPWDKGILQFSAQVWHFSKLSSLYLTTHVVIIQQVYAKFNTEESDYFLWIHECEFELNWIHFTRSWIYWIGPTLYCVFKY